MTERFRLNNLTIPVAAVLLDISPRRLRVLCAAGRVQGAKKLGRDWLIPSPVQVVPGSRIRPGKIKLSSAPRAE
jgi:hypothetical protein